MAWLDDDIRGRKREKERRGVAGGLGSSSPWWDAVDVIMEAHTQALANRHARSRPAWAVRRSAINDKATASPTTCARQRRQLGMKTDQIRTDITHIIFVFIFLFGFGFGHG